MVRLSKKALGLVVATGLTTVMTYEGLKLSTYIDPVGVPTICYGHTKTATLGDIKTEKECLNLLQDEYGDFIIEVQKRVPYPLPKQTLAAVGSFTYNVGVGNLEKSTLLRKLKLGDIAGACNELPRWVYAKGVKLRGLEKRRTAERELCLRGVK